MLAEIITEKQLREISLASSSKNTGRKLNKKIRHYDYSVEHDNENPREVIPINEGESCLCTALWRSVIVQAIYDLSGRGGTRERKMMRAQSAAWFAGIHDGSGQSDFSYVCDMADLSPSTVLKIVREVKEMGEDLIDGMNFRTVRKEYSNRLGRKFPSKIWHKPTKTGV